MLAAEAASSSLDHSTEEISATFFSANYWDNGSGNFTGATTISAVSSPDSTSFLFSYLSPGSFGKD